MNSEDKLKLMDTQANFLQDTIRSFGWHIDSIESYQILTSITRFRHNRCNIICIMREIVPALRNSQNGISTAKLIIDVYTKRFGSLC